VAKLILDCARSIISLEGRLDSLPLPVSNEGLPRPRVVRAKETVELTLPSWLLLSPCRYAKHILMRDLLTGRVCVKVAELGSV